MNIDQSSIDQLRALAEAATEGERYVEPHLDDNDEVTGYGVAVKRADPWDCPSLTCGHLFLGDAKFIAALSTDVVKGLLNEIERLRRLFDPAMLERMERWESTEEVQESLINALTRLGDRKNKEVEKLRTEGSPGVMHKIDQAFFDLTVSQRNLAWQEVETLKRIVLDLSDQNEGLRKELGR